MTIAELAARSKTRLEAIPGHALVAALVILSSSASFGLGILEGREMGSGSPIQIGETGTTSPAFLPAAAAMAAGSSSVPATAPESLPAGGEVVASKNGTKYYLPWCGSVKLIKEENKVWFATKADAEKAGYQPASNCKGL